MYIVLSQIIQFHSSSVAYFVHKIILILMKSVICFIYIYKEYILVILPLSQDILHCAQSYCVAVVVPDPDVAQVWANNNNCPADIKQLCNNKVCANESLRVVHAKKFLHV